MAVGSCVPRSLDTAQLERRIERQLSGQLNVTGIDVSCPADVHVEEGGTFVCIATSPGETDTVRIRVAQVDDDGNVAWEIAGSAG
jgi:hypothetical protein